MRARKWAKVRNAFMVLLFLAAAVYVIYRWGWLGLVAVVILTIGLAALYIVMLAKSFRH